MQKILVFMCICAGLPLKAQEFIELPALNANIVHNTREIVYQVKGRDEKSINKSVRLNTPIEGQFAGHVNWYISWKYRYRQEQHECYLFEIETVLDTEIIMPKLYEDGVNKETLVSWNKFYNSLQNHENGHLKTGINAANEIYNQLKQFKSQNCRLTVEKANNLANTIIDKYKLSDANYDKDTGHGRTQGAIWPPEN